MIPDAYFDRFETPKYREKSALKRNLIRRFVERFHSLFLRASPITSVLEVGMGEGFLSGYLSERFPDVRFEGLDTDAESLDRAARLFPRIQTHRGTVYDLRSRAGDFDLVMCCEVLEHLADPARALDEIVSLAPKRAIFTVPHEPYFMLSNLLRGKNVSRLGNDIDHHNHWGKRSFERLLSSRFDIEVSTTSYPFLLALVVPRSS
ncbi:MAG: class I SAM-dependent methyltransferase [Polyangiaceae bacterium]